MAFWLALALSTLGAVAPVDFSGQWTTVSPGPAMGEPLVIVQDDQTLTMRHGASGGHAHDTAYRLDGRLLETKVASHGRTLTVTTRAKWDGDALILTMSWTDNGVSLIGTQRLSMDKDGRLRIASTETADGRLPRKSELLLARIGAPGQ